MNAESKLRDILEDEKFEEKFAIDGNLLVSISFCIMSNAKVFLYGDNPNLYTFVRMLDYYGLSVCGIILTEENVSGQEDVFGIKVITILEYLEEQRNSQTFVFFISQMGRKKGFLNSYHWHGAGILRRAEIKKEERELRKSADKYGIGYYQIITEEDWKVLTTNTAEWVDLNRIPYYKKNKIEIMKICSMLYDEKSKETLYEYIKSYMQNSVYGGVELQTRSKYWYGEEKEELYQHLNNECWVNCGASIGDTIMSFLSWGFLFEKIIAFEGNKEAFDRLNNTISLIPREEIRNKIYLHNIFIDEHSMQMDMFASQRCTLVNADIEGNELSLIKSIQEIVKCDRPVLAICLYHKKEDIIEIPNYICSLVDNYVFKLRKYTSWWQNLNRNHELVLYAIPKERNL